MPQKLLEAFRNLFDGKVYRHRSSSNGDLVASFLFEDIYDLQLTKQYNVRVDLGQVVYNKANRVIGKVNVRRGDGLLGHAIPEQKIRRVAGLAVARGKVANIQIGIEAKFIGTAMGKQFDRMLGDIKKQHRIFKKVSRSAITVALVGVNCSTEYRSYEGTRTYDSSPSSESARTIDRITRDEELHDLFDEVILLPFAATNVAPFPFKWANWARSLDEYNAALVRLSHEYSDRFP